MITNKAAFQKIDANLKKIWNNSACSAKEWKAKKRRRRRRKNDAQVAA